VEKIKGIFAFLRALNQNLNYVQKEFSFFSVNNKSFPDPMKVNLINFWGNLKWVKKFQGRINLTLPN